MEEAGERRRARAAFTLVEMVLAMFIFGVILVVVGDTVVAAYQNHENRTGDINMVRQGSIAVDTIGRELRMCEHLYYPDPYNNQPPTWQFVAGSNANWQPLKSANNPFVFTYFQQASNSEIVVGYWLNDATHNVERLLYPPNSQPFFIGGVAAPSMPAQPVASFVQSLTFYQVINNLPGGVPDNQPYIGCHLALCRPINPGIGQRFLAMPLECCEPVISE